MTVEHNLSTMGITTNKLHNTFKLLSLHPGLHILTQNAVILNPLTPNGHYIGHTALLTSRRSILNIYSTNIHTEYFKHAA
jgi:hypothetical protein